MKKLRAPNRNKVFRGIMSKEYYEQGFLDWIRSNALSKEFRNKRVKITIEALE